ncbi:glycoside hydrolase superfamily [Phaeosphaeria sp. MPI-PUGE-AT-0046c]|nr:glycoside hydrolase superfamily [Phaeosphaeria sp. MPI-PUGE-AT-0046c]
MWLFTVSQPSIPPHIDPTGPTTQYFNLCLTDGTNSFSNSSIWTDLATKRGTAQCPAATQQLPSLYLQLRITETRFRFWRDRLRNDSEPVRRACENASGRNDTCKDPRDARPRAPKGECASRTYWFYFTLALLAPTVLAQSQTTTTETCNWYCWMDRRVTAIVKHLDELSRKFGAGGYTDVPKPINAGSTPSPTRYASTFGSPYVTPVPNNDNLVDTPVEQASPTTINTSRAQSKSTATGGPYPKPDVEERTGYRAVGYFGNWDVYSRKYFPQSVPASKLTHLLYAFADNTPDGNITLSDSYADVEMHYPGDSWSDSGKNVYGAFKQLGLLKQKNRNLKVLLSIGGWTYTNTKKNLDPVGASDTARKNFAASCVNMIKNYGFDGIDVDWEYPQSEEQGDQFLSMLREVRRAMDDYADYLGRDKGYAAEARPHFLLSIAAPAGADNYEKLPLRAIAETLDFVNLMAYDYAGSWDNATGHASNLAPSRSNPKSTPYNTDSVVKHYIEAGVPSTKLNLGMPLYGRAFTNTAGLGQPYEGVGEGTWEKGVYDFKDLPLPGAREYFDKEAYATYSYDNATNTLITYDTVNMALTKVGYIKQKGLGGAMWWEVSGDRNDSGSIITNVSIHPILRTLGIFTKFFRNKVVSQMSGADGRGIESRPNWIYYPDSQFSNVKEGFSG